ncbi:MAG: carboxypeptidase regulatory-like domain-containing protein, partial [Acidobacteriota bacterium]|nr:carboxypeptidase regulatory-like domain-containing protein [Acidobacteriota bacterium]
MLLLVLVTGSASASTIEGFVFDQGRNPLIDVDVELQNENRQIRGRTRTNGIGRYQFGGLADGRYYIKVMPFKYNLKDAVEEVVVDTFSLTGGFGNDTIQRDFNLESKRGGLADTTTGVVYAQEVPKEAQEFYKQARKSFTDKKQDEGFRTLIKAVDKYPTYFNALTLLGKHLLVRKRYLEAAAMFVRAVEVNP